MAKKKPIVSKEGQWKYPGQETIIPNVNGRITMQGVPYPVLGIDDLGNQQMMMPGEEYQFPGNSVYEIPMAKNGGTKKVKIHSLPKAQDGREWQAPRIVEFGPSRMNPATFQDSIDVGNASQKAMDWYMANGYFNRVAPRFVNPKDPQLYIFPENRKEWKPIENDGPAVAQRIHIGGKNKIGADDLGQGGLQWTNPDITFTIPAGVNQVIQDGFSGIGDLLGQGIAGTANLVKGEQLAEWLNHNQFLQYGDEHQRVLNTDAPRILYDTRIQPRTKLSLQGTAPGYFSGNADLVDLPTYEKWYTTPWSLLSDEDKRKRLEFGILDGTPFKDWNDIRLINTYPDIAMANGGRRQYDSQTIKNAAASGYAPTQEGAAQYEKNKWAKNPRVYDAQTIANAVKSGYPATQSGAAEYELNNWQKKSKSKNSIARKEPNPNTDIAHYMKTELGLDKKQTSYSERKKLAEKYGIKEYSGSAKQNIELLNKIKSEEDPADAVRRMLAGEKLNTALPTDSQPEDFKVPYKGDPSRRSYPIELSGDAAIDNMRQQLFGNLGKFTDNGKIPLDDPKYHPYVGGIGPRTPEQEMKRIAIPPGGFAYGGQIPMAQMGMGMAPPPPPRPAPMKYLPMKELGLLQMPGIDIKPQLQNIPSIELPQITKQRVVVNTAQGDKIRVQDPKTKKFMWWEDQKGLPSDIENPTGVASQDFQFAYGGQLPKAQRGLGTILNRTQRDVIFNDLDDYNRARGAESDSLIAALSTQQLLGKIYDRPIGHTGDFLNIAEAQRRNLDTSNLHWNSATGERIRPRESITRSNYINGHFQPWRVDIYDDPKTHAVYEELPKPVMKEPTPFPIPTLGIKPQLQNIERPKSNKQRVLINTPQGDKIRVQDLKTKKFLGWEDQERLPSDVENPTGTASQDFVYPEPKVIKTPKFNYGGDLPKAQNGKNILYVDSENDPNYIAAQDSSTIANATKNMIKDLRATPNADAWLNYSDNWYAKHGAPNSTFGKAFQRLTKLNKRKPQPWMINQSMLPGGGDFPQTAVQYQPPTRQVIVSPPAPKMIEPQSLLMPGMPVSLQLQNIPSIEYNGPKKQRVVVNTPQGDKVRVQDIRTKKFIDWEETDGAPVDIENPTGTASQDFKYKNGGGLPKAQNGKNILYVDSKKDPAYKAYSDSLNLYKAMIMQDKLMGSNTTNDPYINARRAGSNKSPLSDFTVKSLKEGRTPKLVPGIEYLGPIARDFDNAAELKDFANSIGSKNDIKLVDYYKSLGFNDNNIMYHTSADVVHPKIKPVDSYWDGSAWSPVYKKPRREVIVQKVPDNVPAINTPTQLVSQPEDIKIPLKADLTRRQYPIALTGDAALDRLNQQLYGNLGSLTEDGYIPTDDPKYHPYNGIGPVEPRTPEKEMRRIKTPKFTNGGDISVPNLSRQQGGSNFKTKLNPQEEQQFKQFYQTLPGNLREDDASYDTRGYWDASGRPSEFDYSQPTDEDGYYHAFSRHPETGKILKSPGHPTFKYAVDKTPIDGNTYIPTVGVDGNVYMRDLNQDSENLQRQDGGAAKRFNTNLRGAELEAFNQHAQQFPSLATDTGDYDTQGFYKEVYNKNNGDMNAITAALTPGSPTAHVGNDRYKKPNHPTFSKESKYHIPVLRPAGEWGHNEEGNYDYFNASRRNIKNMTESDGTPLDYFKRAEDYNQDGTPDVKLFYKGQPVFKEGGSVKRVKIHSLPKAQDGINWSDPFKSSFPEQPKSDWYNTMNTMMPQEQEVDWRGTIESMAKPKPYTVPQEYYDELKILENSVKKGYADGKFYPHESIEGGNKTIGYGHKVTDKDISSGQFKKGLGDAEANKLLEDDVAFNTQRAVERYDTRYGKGSFNKLHPELKKLAVDFTYNGINFTAEGDEYKNSFPTFWGAANQYSTTQDEALKQKALQTMLANYQRGAKTENDGSVILGGRNEYTKNILSNLKKNGGELPKAQYGPPDWRNILDYKNAAPPAKQNLVGDVRKVARPTAVAESTNRNVTQAIPENWQELKAEKDAQAAYDALPEAMKRRDTVSANNTSSTQKAINQAYYALSNPVEAAGHAMKYGYVPQGNLGNYGYRGDGDAFSDVTQYANPFFYANAAYRLSNAALQPESWTTKEGLINMGVDFAEALPFFGAAAKTMTPAVRSFASHPLVNGLHDVAANKQLYGPIYAEALASKVANSLTSPLGIPLYKLPGINEAYKNAAYAVGKQSGMQARSIKQVKNAILGKGPAGVYIGGDFSATGQNVLRQYIYGDAPHFKPSTTPQIGLTKYAKKYGPLDNFELKMSIPEGRSLSINDITPSKSLLSAHKTWKSMNPSLAHLDELDDPLSIQNAFADEVRKRGTLALSRKTTAGYTDTDIAGHNLFVTYDPATDQFSSHIQDIWKFTPDEYAKRHTVVGNPAGKLAQTKDLNQYKIYQQAKLMEKAGKPFVLHDTRPFEIFPTIKGKPAAAPQILQLAEEADPNATGFKAMYNTIDLKKPIINFEKLGGAVKRVKINTLPNNWKSQ